MAINYPTSLDSFTNPSASSLLTSPSHAQQHADINDAMEAVQTKLAIGHDEPFSRPRNFSTRRMAHGTYAQRTQRASSRIRLGDDCRYTNRQNRMGDLPPSLA
jgi:hypothetical protein